MHWDAASYEGQHTFVWKYGADLLPLLDPKPGKHILDLGCGTGHLTAKIADSGALVVGIDNSPDMIAQARLNYPNVEFRLSDAAKFSVERRVDAVFSNAVLHWIRDAEGVVGAVERALKPGGRFVAEFGGKGNVGVILRAAEQILGREFNPWYFPSVGEYSTLLERHGFEIRYASLFDRPTELEDSERGMRDWLAMFGGPELKAIAAEIEEAVRPELFRNGRWYADYRRLRIAGVKIDITSASLH